MLWLNEEGVARSLWLWGCAAGTALCSMSQPPLVPAPSSPCPVSLSCGYVPAFPTLGAPAAFSLFSSHEKGLDNYTLETFLELRINSREAEFYSLLSRTYPALGIQCGTHQFLTFFTYDCPAQNEAVSWGIYSGHLLSTAFTYQGYISGIPPTL